MTDHAGFQQNKKICSLIYGVYNIYGSDFSKVAACVYITEVAKQGWDSSGII